MFGNEQQKLLANSLASIQGATSTGQTSSIMLNGRMFSASYAPGGKNRPPLYKVIAFAKNDPNANPVFSGEGGASYRGPAARPLGTKDLGPILLRPESSTDALGKQLTLNKEIQVGDPSFDNAYYIETEVAPEVVRAVLSPDVRAALIPLLTRGTVVLYDGGALVTVSKPAPTDDELSGPLLSSLVGMMNAVAGKLPHDAPVKGKLLPAGNEFAIVAVIAFLMVLMLSMFGLGEDRRASVLDLHEFEKLALGVVCLLGPLQAAIVFHARGRSNGLRIVGTTLLCLWTIGALFLAGNLRRINQAFDGSPGVERSAQVLALRSVPVKNHFDYQVEVQPWTPSQRIVFHVQQEEFSTMTEGRNVLLRVHPGALGMSWVKLLR